MFRSRILHICLQLCLLALSAHAAQGGSSIDILLRNPVTSSANISLLVQDLQSGEVIDAFRSTNVAPPASVMKLLPTATALETLGADYRFSTTCMCAARAIPHSGRRRWATAICSIPGCAPYARQAFARYADRSLPTSVTLMLTLSTPGGYGRTLATTTRPAYMPCRIWITR